MVNDDVNDDANGEENVEAVNCERAWLELSNYLEGDVDPRLRTAMDQHFSTCQRCASVLAGTRNVVRLYSDERMIEVPAGFGRRLEKSIEKRVRQRAQAAGRSWPTLSTWLIPLAALGLFAGGLRIANSLAVNRPLQSQHAQPGKDFPPDLQVVVTTDAKVFHLAGCGVIHNQATERTLTAKEAMEQGYVPCLRCLRKYLDTAAAGDAVLGAEAHADEDGEESAEPSRPAGH